MRVLTAILFLLLSIQSAAAGLCDMSPDAQPAEHIGMHHGAGQGMDGHDCCDPAGGGDSDQDDSTQCGACFHASPALPAMTLLAIAQPQPALQAAPSEPVSANQPLGLYRPPRSES